MVDGPELLQHFTLSHSGLSPTDHPAFSPSSVPIGSSMTAPTLRHWAEK